MDINILINIVRDKLQKNILLEDLIIEDKTFLHKNNGKFHLKLIIKSLELKNKNKIQSTKKIYSILKFELKEYIHSIQILIN
jgi:BolA protein